ncbi:MAG: hypothetical protein ACOCV2_15810 [Persicimonas sp.]
MAAIVIAPTDARADDSSDLVFDLTLADDPEVDSNDPELAESKLREMTRMTTERLEDRLEAARIKHVDTHIDGARKIQIRVYGDYERRHIEGILIPSGRFELRPVEAVGDLLLRELPGLPRGVELRQESGSLTNHDAYLWSQDRRQLEQALEDIDMEGLELKVYPDGELGGWKSVALGPPVATHRDIASASASRSSTGQPHVRVDFRRRLTSRDDGPHPYTHWAAVLDGEVVTMKHHGESGIGDVVTLPAPSHLGSQGSIKDWTRQVAGRLGAYIPVTLVEMDEES